MPSSDHCCIEIVVPSSDHCCVEKVPPSSDIYGTTKVVRKRAPLETLVPLGGAPCGDHDNQSGLSRLMTDSRNSTCSTWQPWKSMTMHGRRMETPENVRARMGMQEPRIYKSITRKHNSIIVFK